MFFEDAFDLHASDLDICFLWVFFERSDSSRQYDIRHVHALRQSRLFAVPLSPMQTSEVAAQVVGLPVCDDVTVGDVATGGGDGQQPETGD